MNEIWKQIPDFLGYEVSNWGRVRSFWVICGKRVTIASKAQRILKQSVSTQGYYQVTLRKEGKPYCRKIHTLVLTSFVGPRPPKMQCRHLDGNKKRNHDCNLKWGTQQENAADAIFHGTFAIGERNGQSKLTPEKILEIKKLRSMGYSQEQVAHKFNINRSCVSKLEIGESWRYLSASREALAKAEGNQ